jgi:hypothetical protein
MVRVVFVEPERSMPYSHNPATGLHPEQDIYIPVSGSPRFILVPYFHLAYFTPSAPFN